MRRAGVQCVGRVRVALRAGAERRLAFAWVAVGDRRLEVQPVRLGRVLGWDLELCPAPQGAVMVARWVRGGERVSGGLSRWGSPAWWLSSVFAFQCGAARGMPGGWFFGLRGALFCLFACGVGLFLIGWWSGLSVVLWYWHFLLLASALAFP